MLFEIFGICSLVIFAILVYAETGKRKELGVVAALLLAILCFAVNSDGIQIPTGQTVTTSSFFNATDNMTATNMTVSTVRSDVTLDIVDFNQTFLLVGALFAIFMFLYYAFRIMG